MLVLELACILTLVGTCFDGFLDKVLPSIILTEKLMGDVKSKPTKEDEVTRSKPEMFGSFYIASPHKPRDIHYWGTICSIAGFVFAVLIFAYSVWPQPSPKVSKKKYRILVPLQANSTEYSTFIQKEGDTTFEGRYTNKASQNIREIVKAAKNQWLTDNPPNSRALKEGDDIDFFCFPEGYDGDKESYERAFKHALSAADAGEREVVAILGNVSSTSTLKYGEFAGKYKLPMILPLATATNLIHDLEVLKVPAVLRLPPPNDKQAKVISDFLLHQNRIQQTVVVQDLSNETWSRDLVESFRENYVQLPLSEPATRESGKFGHIISVVPVGGQETQPFLYSILSGSAQDDALLVIGMTNASVETLTQVKTSKAAYSYTILTDGAVDEYLDKQIISIQGEHALSNLYLAFPVPCVMPQALKGYVEAGAKLNLDDFKLTHALFVADGAYLITSILNQGLLNDANASGRAILINAVNKLKSGAKQTEADMRARGEEPRGPVGQPITMSLPFNNSDKRQYEIDKTGSNIAASYYLFNIVAIQNDGKRAIEWRRAKGMSSPLKCYEDVSSVH